MNDVPTNVMKTTYGPPWIISGLTPGVSYDVQVRAFNNQGACCWSSVVSKTAAAVPDAPVPCGRAGQ